MSQEHVAPPRYLFHCGANHSELTQIKNITPFVLKPYRKDYLHQPETVFILCYMID